MFCGDGLPTIDRVLAYGNDYFLILFTFWSVLQSTAAAMKAIRESGMNLNPEVDGTLIRVPVPKWVSIHGSLSSSLCKVMQRGWASHGASPLEQLRAQHLCSNCITQHADMQREAAALLWARLGGKSTIPSSDGALKTPWADAEVWGHQRCDPSSGYCRQVPQRASCTACTQTPHTALRRGDF